jgi:NitT/TauT family transport system substrate-binding protein
MSRRSFLQQASALGAASLFGFAGECRAEPPPEIRKIRLVHDVVICNAPQYLAEDFLRLEGFSHVEHVRDEKAPDPCTLVAAGRADLALDNAPSLLRRIDQGHGLTILAGVHGGCFELFGNDRVRTVRDLAGKRIAITRFFDAEHIYISSIMAYVGINPLTDVNWIETGTFGQPMDLFVEGKADAFLGFPPQPQQVRAKKIGHTLINIALDKPWSQHFCCMLVGYPPFVSKHPVATKRAIRAVLKAADVCAREPERTARYMVEKGYEESYALALEVVKELSYDAWREFNPEDTLRFLTLRLHEVGMVKSTPQRIIERGTNFSFLNELKKEMKA